MHPEPTWNELPKVVCDFVDKLCCFIYCWLLRSFQFIMVKLCFCMAGLNRIDSTRLLGQLKNVQCLQRMKPSTHLIEEMHKKCVQELFTLLEMWFSHSFTSEKVRMRKDQQLLFSTDLEFILHTPQSFHAFYSVAFPSRNNSIYCINGPRRDGFVKWLFL